MRGALTLKRSLSWDQRCRACVVNKVDSVQQSDSRVVWMCLDRGHGEAEQAVVQFLQHYVHQCL